MGHKVAKVEQDRNRCCADSKVPQPETHNPASGEMTPLRMRFVLVGKRSRSSLKKNITQIFSHITLMHYY